MVSVEALARASVEEPLVQILIVVVIRNMKSISAEANKVISKMVFSWEWVDPKRRLKQLYIERNWAGGNSGLSNSSMSRKGNRLKFRYWVRVWVYLCLLGLVCGDTKELEDGRRFPRQRSLLCSKRWNGRLVEGGNSLCLIRPSELWTRIILRPTGFL